MGRRPNVIVTEFFERGAKLEDSSNRYQHTCKRCGELFPKGRVENLVNHLLKACPNVTLDDRKIIAHHVQQTSKKSDSAFNLQSTPNVPQGQLSGLPITLERQQSALDTLAEVSRRHLDYSSLRGNNFDQSQLLHDADQTLAEQALWTQLQQHNLGINTQTQGETFSFDADPALQGLQQHFSTSDYVPSLMPTSNAQSIDPQLGPEAAFDMSRSAGQLVPSSQGQNRTSIDWAAELTDDFQNDVFGGDGRKDNEAVQVQPAMEANAQAHNTLANESRTTQAVEPARKAGPYEGVLNISQGKGSRSKQRQRFTESRRKQVQELRKQGACLRCRMLKKPCSEGTPCNTCANIDTARLWKAPCTRSRIADEFTAWTAGYFQALAQHKLQTWSPGAVMSHRLSVKLDFDADRGIQVVAKPGVKMTASNASGELTNCTRLDMSDDLPDKLAAYCMTDAILTAAISGEPHHFLRTTLIESIDLLAKEKTQAEENSRSETRSCYSIPNSLTRDTLELWMLTAILTASVEASSFSPRFMVSDIASEDASQDLIQAQLLAAIEHRAGRLSRKVLNDLERRLLQRQQVSGFATYIAALVLLSCVERMAAFFQSLDTAEEAWPIANTAQSIWNQATPFTALLAMLLRMRGLPPKTVETDNGKLVVLCESSEKLLKINGSASEEQLRALDEQRRSALTAWLAKCDISAAEIRKWSEESSKSWYGRLMAALLQ